MNKEYLTKIYDLIDKEEYETASVLLNLRLSKIHPEYHKEEYDILNRLVIGKGYAFRPVRESWDK